MQPVAQYSTSSKYLILFVGPLNILLRSTVATSAKAELCPPGSSAVMFPFLSLEMGLQMNVDRLMV